METSDLILISLSMPAGIACLLYSRRRNAATGYGELRCSACGYLVRGLPGPICPECGSDLRVPGSISRGKPPLTRGQRAFLWMLFVILTVSVPFGTVWVEVSKRFPLVYGYDMARQLQNPVSEAYREVRIDYSGGACGRGWPAPSAITVTLTKLDGTLIGTTSQSHSPGQPKGAASGDAAAALHLTSGSEVLAWMNSAGISMDNSNVRGEADLIAQEIRDCIASPLRNNVIDNHPYFTSHAMRRSTSAYPPWWLRGIPAAISLTLLFLPAFIRHCRSVWHFGFPV